MSRAIALAALTAATALSGCTLAPRYERPAMPTPQAWPVAAQTGAVSAGDLAWTSVFLDPRLQEVIKLALAQNRDLRVAVSDIERARSQYRIQRAALAPAITAVGSQTQSRSPADLSPTGQAAESEQYSATVGLSAYEIDLFGRVRSLSTAALQNYFATEEAARAVQVSLVAEVATAYLTLAADQDLLAVNTDTLASREQAEMLIRRRFEGGATSQLDLRQAQTLAEQARSDVATATALVNLDLNALRLLVGAEPPARLLPSGGVAGIAVLADLPAGLPSEVLTQRPDVLAAEHALQAQNANIGAARAAFFPRISLTGAAGVASPQLDTLFGDGSGTWSFLPQVSLPIFNGGANIAGLGAARANRDIALSQYEKAVQSAFREVSDALAVQATIRDRVGSQRRLVEAAADSQRLTQARYDRGVDGYLALLDAQRSLYAARQALIETERLQALNRVALYRALGGGATRTGPVGPS